MNQTNLFHQRPQAVAEIRGSGAYPRLRGWAAFYQTRRGTIVRAEVTGLPTADPAVFGFHIHTGSRCTGSAQDPFADVLAHFDIHDNSHPSHTGDLPPLFGNNGYAFSVFLTDRFSVSEVVGRTVIIHAAPDDLMTQPAGNSGQKIACGVIRAARK